MPRAVISDSSCFITLVNIGRVELLQWLYEIVLTTPEVAAEVGGDMPSWVEVRGAQDHDMVQRLNQHLDPGEASAIALALELPGCMLILDDLDARKEAGRRGLDITGTIGVLVAAKIQGHLTTLASVLDDLDRVGFRSAKEVRERALRLAGESPEP